MTQSLDFDAFLGRIRGGDPAAATELWSQFEPILRREVRLRLRDPQLRRLLDENDICQSVMKSFFVRAAAGQFDLEGPEQLQRLLIQMGRNKLANQRRRHQRQRRDCHRAETLAGAENAMPARGETPSQIVAWKELLQQFRDRLDDEERQLADLRAQGHSWMEIVALLGGSPDSRRMQLNRAIARVSKELDLDEYSED